MFLTEPPAGFTGRIKLKKTIYGVLGTVWMLVLSA
jgi:hypothetical protein